VCRQWRQRQLKSAKSDVQSSAEFNSALRIALDFLAKRDRFSAEIAEALKIQNFSAEVAEQVLGHLRGKGLLDDRRTAAAFVRRYSGKRAAGREKIKHLLIERGASPDLIEELLDSSNEADIVLNLLATKFPNGASLEKAGRFLYSRGFSEDEINSALEKWRSDTA